MSWFLSMVVAVITGFVALFVSGFVALLVVDWYRVSSFEGGSGYAVVASALLGSLAGGVIGLVSSRLLAAAGRPGFLWSAGAACGVVLATGAVVAAAARLLADVPPELNGQRMLLAVELRWPASGAPDPAASGGVGRITLGSIGLGRRMRVSNDGPLWLDRATRVEGRWVVPGAVELFTNRGTRLLEANAGDQRLGGFILPLRGSPGREHLEWSDWMPRAKPGAAPLPDQLTYRYRVVRVGDPIRLEAVGPFQVGTAASSFYRSHRDEAFAASSRFLVSFRGRAVPGLDDVRAAAVLGGSPAALLLQLADRGGEVSWRLVVDGGDAAAVEAVPARGGSLREVSPVTSDAALFDAEKARVQPNGWLDRETFRTEGLFLLNDVVIDTAKRTVRPVKTDPSFSVHTGVPPLGGSPDGNSLVRFGYAGGATDRPALLVARLDGGEVSWLPVDRARMRYSREEDLDPSWVLHHFLWTTGPDGADRLAERETFTPIPYEGRLTVGYGNAHEYLLAPAGAELRAALVEFLVKELGAERVDATDPDAYAHRVRVGGQAVLVSASRDARIVTVTTEERSADQAVVDRIAGQFDAALATGRYDALFGR